ncbi:MAG: two-component sensor histidine kinase [Clostridiales bacterium]|jgi:signal transduction histidine kinase|nr:two-component sensor histidine kinase [Clostridiales bacterium]
MKVRKGDYVDKIVEKVILFVCGLILLALDINDITTIVLPVVITIAISAINSYFENDIFHLILFFTYCIICISFPIMTFFLPLIIYDVIGEKFSSICVLSLSMIFINNTSLGLVPLVGVSIWFKIRALKMDELKQQYKTYRDTSIELAISLEERNKDLIQRQDYEVQVAILNERNRIAREIHDNVGHLLSSSLLQIGALLAINKDANMAESIHQVRSTLSTGMESIRSSVHNLHDDAIDLKTQVETIVNNFKGYNIKLDFDISDSVDKKIKYCFIAIIKESLSNIIKHSNATLVTIKLREHPAIIQLVIWDNGVVKHYNPENGIGLSNIRDRIAALNGIVNISIDKGFRVFISVPKEGNE